MVYATHSTVKTTLVFGKNLQWLKDNRSKTQDPQEVKISSWNIKTFFLHPCQRPYHDEYTSSRQITEVKQHWVLECLGTLGAVGFKSLLQSFPFLFLMSMIWRKDWFGKLWWGQAKVELRYLSAICWAFLTKGHQNENEKSPQSMLQSLSNDAEQNSIKTSCLGCPRLISTAQKALSKIILHRIISVVWLTNFLSEIRSLSNHDDETQFRILSVKPIWSFSAFDHWWSLTVQLWAVMDGE